LLDSKTSKRIFELAKDQQDELESSNEEDEFPEDERTKYRGQEGEDEDEDDAEVISEGSVDAEEYAEFVRV